MLLHLPYWWCRVHKGRSEYPVFEYIEVPVSILSEYLVFVCVWIVTTHAYLYLREHAHRLEPIERTGVHI